MQRLVLLALVFGFAAPVPAQVEPPARLNYQGVLRDSVDDPLDGAFDMTFRLFSAAAAGDEILVDDHTGAGAVTVTAGLFSADLGGGAVSDGSGLGVYTTLAQAFRDYSEVWLEVEVATEVLTPRVRVLSAAYALNADHLDGRDSSGFLDTSAAGQTKSGDLTVADLVASGGDVTFGGGGHITNAGGTELAILAGVDDTDNLTLQAGNDFSDGKIGISGDGPFELRAGNGHFHFFDGTSGLERATVTSAGDLLLDGDLTVDGNDVAFGGGALISTDPSGVQILSGLDNTDSLLLQAGNDFSDGRIGINGDGPFELRSGSGFFHFFDGTSGLERATLTPGGDWLVDGSITVNDLAFADGASILGDASGLSILAGADDADSLELRGGNSVEDGQLRIKGGLELELRAGNGVFRFLSVGGNETARLDQLGHLQIDGDLTASGNDILFGAAGASVVANDVSLQVLAGNAATDDLVLQAGTSAANGRLFITGGGPFEMRSGSGLFQFLDTAGTETASLTSSGNLQIDGDLTASGNDIFFGEAGSRIVASPGGLNVLAGDADTDIIVLRAGNSSDDGQLTINGNAFVSLTSGSGVFQFHNGATSTETASLNAVGNLQIDGDITVSGNTVTTPGSMTLDAGTGFNIIVQSDFELIQHIDFDATTAGENADWCANGNCTGANHLMELQEDGDLRVGGLVSENQFDLAEMYLKGEPVEPGDLVRIDPDRTASILLSAGEGDATVLGVISERPGVLLGGAPFGVDALEQMWGADLKERFLAEKRHRIEAVLVETPELAALAANLEGNTADLEADLESRALEAFYAEHFAPVALAGRVPVKVDTQYGAIAAGDALAPSPIPGVGMKAAGHGPIVGIALESFSGGRGKVAAFVVRDQASTGIREVRQQIEDDLDERTAHPVTGIQTLPGHFQVVLDRDANDEARFSILSGEAPALAAEVFRVDEQGNVFAKGSFRPAAMDLAEYFPVAEPVEVGDVLVADAASPGTLILGRNASDPAVVGIVSGEPGVLLGSGISRIAAAAPDLALRLEEARALGDRTQEEKLWSDLQARFVETHAPVALSGTVACKVDAGYGAIRVGDLLTASPTPGHAMWTNDPRPGTILGKALEPLAGGTGTIRVLVMLR